MTTFIKNIFKYTPNDWLIDRFEDYVDFQEGPGLRRWQFADSGIPFLNIRCIKKNGDIDEDNLQYLREEDNEKYKHFLLREGDTVLSSSGSLGRMAVIKKKHLPIMLNTSIIKLKSKNIKSLNDNYMRWFAKSDYFSQQFLQESQGSAQVNFGPTHLKKMYILLPPLKEQEKIADILSTADAKIDAITTEIERTQTLKKGLLQKLLSEGIGHSEFKDSEVGKIPVGWEVVELEKLLTFKNGVNASKEQYGKGYRFINVLDIINNLTIKHDNIIGFVDIDENEFELYEVKYGDVLFQRSSETKEEVGQSNVYLDKEQSATFGGFVIRGSAKQEYNPVFINYLFKIPAIRKQMTSKSGGSTRYNIGQNSLNQVVIQFPPLKEQKQIADILSTADEKLEILRAKKQSYETLKKGLLQKLLSGELRV